MKKWLLRIGAVIGLIIAGLIILLIWTDSDTTVVTKFVENENLPTIKPDWPGTPVDQKEIR